MAISAQDALINTALAAIGYYKNEQDDHMKELKEILLEHPPVLGLAQILQMNLVMPRTENMKKDHKNAHEIKYKNIEDIKNAVEEVRALALIQRNHLGNEMAALIDTVTTQGFEPNPMAFDGLMIQYHSVPLLLFTNAGDNESCEYSLFLEMNTLRMLVTKSVKDSVQQAVERSNRERFLRAMERNNNTKLAMVTVVTTGLAAVIMGLAYLQSRKPAST